MKIKFKHKKKSLLKAIGSNLKTKDVNVLISDAMRKFMKDDNLTEVSQLAEIVHNDFPYEAILFIAVHGIKDRATASASGGLPIEGLMDELRKRNEGQPHLEVMENIIKNITKKIAEREGPKEDTSTKD